jgi:arylsulfatase A-like enzyme
MRGSPVLALLLAVACASEPDQTASQIPDVYSYETPGSSSRAPGRAEHVVLVSFDGLRPDAIEATAAQHLNALIVRGAYCPKAQTIRPSVTFPSHTSMVTGLDFPRHGVVWNNYRPGLIAHPTAFSVVHGAGLSSAIYYSKEKFKFLADVRIVDRIFGPPLPKKVPTVQDYSDIKYLEKEEENARRRDKPPTTRAYSPRAGDPETSALALARRFAEEWPSRGFAFTLVHLREPDEGGHRWEWMKDGYLESVLTCDRALGVILEAIRRSGRQDKTAVIVTADHGGSQRDHFVHKDKDRPENVTIPWICAGPGVKPGTKIDRVVRVFDTMPTALALLGLEAPGGIDGKVVEEVLR